MEMPLESTSIVEINYYSSKIHLIVDEAEINNPNNRSIFTKKQSQQLKEYRQNIMDATHIEEIDYYKEKIINLIDSAKGYSK
jgi:hypothetical protein